MLRADNDHLQLLPAGLRFCESFGIDIDALSGRRRPLCRACLDWSVRRRHLAGTLGAAILARCFALGWARRTKDSRVINFNVSGEQIGRASCRGRVCQYVSVSVVAGLLTKKNPHITMISIEI